MNKLPEKPAIPEAKEAEIIAETREQIGLPSLVLAVQQQYDELGRCKTSVDDRRCLREGIVDLFTNYPFVRFFEQLNGRQQEAVIALCEGIVERLKALDSELAEQVEAVITDLSK